MTDLNRLYDDFTHTGTTITFDEFSEGMKDEGFKSFVDAEVGELKKKDNSQSTDPLTTEMPTSLPQDFSVPMGSETDLPLLEQQKEDSMLGTGEIPTSTELASQPMASLSEESQSNSTALQQVTEGDSAKGLPKVVNPITNAPKSVKPTTPTVPAMPKAVTEVTPITKKDTALKELDLGEDEVEEPVTKSDKYISTQTDDAIFQIPKERLEVAGVDAEGNTFFNTKDGKFQMIYKDGILQSPVRESIINADGSSTELPPKVYGKDFFVTKEGYIRFADEMPENKTTTDYKLSIPPFDEFIEDTLSKNPVLANDAVLAKEKEGKVAIKKDINGNLLTNDDGEYIWKYTDKELYDQEVERIKAHNAGNGFYDNEVDQNRSDYAKNNRVYNELLQGAQAETEVKNEAIRLLGDEIAKKYNYAPSKDEIDAELLQLRANQIAASGNYTPEQAAQIASQEKEAAMQSDRKVSSDIAFQFLQQAEKVSRGEDRSTNKKFKDDLKLTDSEKAVWQSLASDPEFGKWYNTYGVKLFGDAETGLITNASTTTLRKRVVDTYMNFRQSELSDRISVIDRARGNQKKMDVIKAFESGDLNKIESARSERTPVLQAQQGIVAKFQELGVRSGEYNKGFDILYARGMKAAEEFAGYKNNDAGDKAIVTAKNIANGFVNVAADIVGGVVVLPSLFSETAKNYASAYDYSTKNAFDILNEGMTDKFKEYSKDGSTVKVYNGKVFNVGKDGSLKYNEGLTNSQSELNDWKFVKEDSEVNMAGVARTFSNQIPMMAFPELMAGRLAAVKSGRMLKNMINVANLAGKESLIGKNILAFARSPKDVYSALLWGEQVMKSNVIAGQEAGLNKEQAFLYGALQSVATMSLLKISPDAKFFGEYKAVNRDIFKLISQGKYDVAKRTFLEGMKKLGKSNFGEMGQEEIERNAQNLINQTFNTVLGDNKDGSKKFSTGSYEEFTQTWQETGVITTGLELFNAVSGRGRLKLKGNSNLQNHILASLIPEFESQYLDSVEQSSWTGVTSEGTAETRAKLKKIREYTNQIPPNTELHLSETEQYVISMQTIEDLQKKKDAASDVLADQYDAKIAEEKTKIDGLFEMANERKNSKSNEDTAPTDEAPETTQDETPTAEATSATDKPINPEDNGGGSAEVTPETQPEISFNGIEFTAIVGDKLLTGNSEMEVQSKIDKINAASTPSTKTNINTIENESETSKQEESRNDGTTQSPEGINDQTDDTVSQTEQDQDAQDQTTEEVTDDELAAIDAELEELKKSQNDNGKSTETSDADGNTEPTGSGIQQTEQGQDEGNQQEIPKTTNSTTSEGENEVNSDEYSLNNKTYTRKSDGTYTTKDKNDVERPVAKKETIAALEDMYDERNLVEKTEKDGYTLKRYNDGSSKITTPKGTVVSSKIIRTRKANKRERKNGIRGDVDSVIRNPNFSKIMQDVFGEESEFTISNERKQRLKEALMAFVPTNEREIAMIYFAEGGKVSSIAIGYEILGNSKDGKNEDGKDKSTAEFQWAYFGKIKQNESFETLAEKLMEDYPYLGIDANDLRSNLIDVVSSYSGVLDIQEDILNLYNRANDPNQGMTDEEIEERTRMELSPKEIAMIESIEAEESLSDKERQQYYLDYFNNTLNSLTDEQQDELYTGKKENTGTDQGIQSKNKTVSGGKNESKTNKREQEQKVKTSPEYVAIEKEIEEAENETRIAKEALDKKAKELDKGLLDDQEDLFGERKSQQNPTMFDERATSEARDKAVAPFKNRYENAKDKVRKLKDQRDQLTGENTTGEMDFDAEQKPSTTNKKPAPKKSSSTSTKKEPKAKKTVIRDTALQDEIRKQAEAFRKTLGQLNSGVNPQTIIEGSKLVALYVKGGVYKFADIVRDIHGNIFKVSEDVLKGLRAAYGAYRENADQDVFDQMDSSTRGITLADLNNVEDTTEETTEENEKDKKPKESGKKQSSDNGGNDSGKTTKLSDKLNAPDNGSIGGTKGSNSKRPDIVVQANPPKVKNHITGDYEIDESQKAGVNAALDRFDKGGRGFLLADGTGVGKTRQILATAQEFYKKTGKKVLIISQNKTILDNNFAKDAKAMGIDMSIFEAGTYDGIRTGKVGKEKYGLVIYDEAHNLKNSDSEKSIAANNIDTDHEMYVTATPMDTFPSAVYFISAVTGLSEEDVYRNLGLNVKSGVNEKGEKILTVTPQKGVSAEAIRQNLLGIRDRIINDGGMIRREYPFYGEFQEDTVPLTEDELQEESEIEEYWDAEIDAAIGRKKMNLSAQKSGELSRWNESRKVKYVVKQALKEIKAGRKVVIIAEGVNDTYIKALDKNVKGFVNEAVRRLEEQGITVAKIYGKNDKAIANDQFQDGDAQVVIGTAISASTGIDLDDQVGDTPRTLFMVTSNYSGNVFQQILGRVSRRNTKSPAKIRMIFKESISDGRRKQIVGGKLQTLQAIQNGTIQDDFDITTVPDSGNNPVKEVGDLTLTDYGEKAVAIFGDSRNIKDDLKALGGRFNPKLTDPATGEKKAGWIFPKAKRTELENLIDNREQASKLVMDDSDPDNVFVSESITDYMPSLFPEGNEDAFERELEQEEVKSNNLFNSVKAIWNKYKNLQFTGTTKVQNAADVAEIMKLLENKSVEHAFAVHIDGEGNSHIQFLSIGGTVGTVVDANLVSAGVAKFGSKKVYLVHNHPSGNMKPSNADLNTTMNLREGLDPLGIEVEHIIMDTYKKEYVVIDNNNTFRVEKRNGKSPDTKLETYILNEQEILGEPITRVLSSRDAFAATQQFRFSAMPKNAMLVLDQNNNVIGNYILPNGISYKDVIKNVGETGIGRSVIFYGNQNNTKEINSIKRALTKLDIRVLDHIVTNSNNDAVSGFYDSMADQDMLLEDQAKYGTNSISEDTYTLREPDNEYTVITKSNPLPITEIRKALAAAKSSIKEGVQSIKDSKWYDKLSDKRKAMITEQNFIDIIQQSRTAIQENSDRAKLGKDEALKIERERSKEKLNEQAKTFAEKIVKIKEDFNAKLQKLRETNKDAKNKIAARKMISRQAYNKVIQMLSDPAIKNDLSPSAIKALLKKADRLLNARDTAKVLDEFYDLAQRIEERIGRSKKLKLKQSEADFERYNEIKDIIMDEIVKGTNAEEIMKLFPDANDFDLAKRALNDIKSDDVSIQKALSLVEQAQDESERIVKSRPKEGSMIDKTMKALVDRQYMPKKLLDAINAGTTVDRMINFAGANSRAKHQFDVAYDEIWKGLSNAERKLLDLIITNRRYIAIDENRAMRGIPPIINTAIEVEKADGTIEKINLNGKIAAKAIEALRTKHGNEMIDKLIGRSDKYFDQFKGLLKEMKNSGLISDIEYDNMAEIDYQPRVFLDKMLDFEGNMKDGKDRDDFMKSTGLNAEQIKSLRDGSEASLMMRSEWLLGNAFISRNKAMMINNVNVDFMTRTYPNAKITFEKYQSIDANKRTKEQKRFIKYFTELQSKIKENPITGFNSNGNPEYKYSKVPQGYKSAYYHINGMQHRFLMEETLYNDWHDTVSKFDPDASWLTKTASAPSRIVKFFATGNNPAFALVNTPRDFWHTYNFSSEYSPFLLKGMFDLTKDFIKGIREISRYDKGKKDNLMYKAMEYGVGMDFLNTQGAIERGDNISKVTDSLLDKKIQDKASPIIKKYFLLKNISRYSEVMFRVAIFDRSLKNQLKDYNKEFRTAFKNIEDIPDTFTTTNKKGEVVTVNGKVIKDDMYNAAARSARSVMDFNQGGRVTKDAEAFIPYINAATQGSRVAFQEFAKNPVTVSGKMLQTATLFASTAIGISAMFIAGFKDDDDERSVWEIYLHAIDGITKRQRTNGMNIVYGYNKETGEYKYFSFAKSQALTPLMNLVENLATNYMREEAGLPAKSWKEILTEVGYAFSENVDPTGLSDIVTNPRQDGTLDSAIKALGKFPAKNPLMKGLMTYLTGYDFFFEQDLIDTNNGTEKRLEGMNSESVENFYKQLGWKAGASPVRTKALVESVFTSPTTNPHIAITYAGLNAISDAFSGEETKYDVEYGIKAVGLNRLLKETTGYARQVNIEEKIDPKLDAIKAEQLDKKMNVDQLANFVKNKKDWTDQEIDDTIAKIETITKDPEEQEKIIKKLINKVKNRTVDSSMWNIKFNAKSDEERAYKILRDIGDAVAKPEIEAQLKQAGIWTENIQKLYLKYYAEREQEKRKK